MTKRPWTQDDTTPLDEFDREEWWDVWRAFRGDTRDEFEKAWAEFAAKKAEHKRRKGLQ